MLKLIRNRAALVLAGLIAAVAPMLMAPSGGYPSRPQFLSASISGTTGTLCPGGSDTANLCVNNTTTGHTAWSEVIRPLGGAGNILGEYIVAPTANSTDTLFRVDTSGTSYSIKGDGSVTGFASSATTGANTLTFVSGCTAAVNLAARLSKNGNVVTITYDQFNCTSNSVGGVQFSGIPAAYQPTGTGTGRSGVANVVAVSDAGTPKVLTPNICPLTLGCTAGNVVFSPPSGTTLSGAGAFAMSAQSFTYTLD